MSELGKTYIIRDYRESDKAFVMSTWLRGLYYGSEFFKLADKTSFMNHYKLFLDAIISNPKNTILVACLKDEPDTILGYSVLTVDFKVVHWIFVKLLFRNKGVGKSLCPQNPEKVTHMTDEGV